MPRRAKELSPLAVRRLTKPGLHAVGGVAGLHLQIMQAGTKTWILRVMVGDRRRDIGLGSFPEVTLAAAREAAALARAKIRQGIDPVEERRAARAALKAGSYRSITFDEACQRYLVNKMHEFSNAKHATQWRATLEQYASPVIGKLSVRDIELPDIIAVLQPIWLEKTETAKRLRGRIESVLSWCTVSGYRRGDNPARWRGNLDVVLPKPGKVATVQHLPAMPLDEVPAFYAALSVRDGIAARALQFLALTVTRSGDVRGATWDEIDMDDRTWTIPAARLKIKSKGDHRVPLSDAAVAILAALPRFAGCDLVFPGRTGKELADTTLSRLMKDVDAVPHGFRSSFRDWCSERTSHPHEVIEQALAHTISSAVERAYRRGDLFVKRAKLMEEWAAFVTHPKPAADVQPIHNRSKRKTA